MASTAAAPTVLYLGGAGRSGSTLLERLLGAVPGIAATGELVHLWARGLSGDERCGCGSDFSVCPFWVAVGERAYGGWSSVDIERSLDLRQVDRTRFIPYLVAPRIAPARYRTRLTAWTTQVEALYAGIGEASGAKVIVDSSKHASYAFLLHRLSVDLRVVLVVRDSRGVAYSWAKKVRRPEVTGSEAFMPRYSVLRTSGLWWANNVGVDVLRAVGVPVLVLRYEDLLAEPVRTLQRVLDFSGLEHSAHALQVEGAVAQLSRDHTVAGNPMRFKVGPVELRLDDQWKMKMPRRTRMAVTLLTWPLLRRYGYLRRA